MDSGKKTTTTTTKKAKQKKEKHKQTKKQKRHIVFCLVETTLRGILLMDSENILLISGAELCDRQGQKLFFFFKSRKTALEGWSW